MQKITIIGRLGRDAAIREKQNGGKFISFTVAVNGRTRGGVEKTSWYEVIASDRYEAMAKYLTKGSGVIVIGELDADVETGTDGAVRCKRLVIADTIEFNSSGTSGNTQTNTSSESKSKPIKTETEDEDVSVTSRKRKVVEKKPTVVENEEESESEVGDEGDLPF